MANLQAIQKLAKQALETFRSIKGDRNVFQDKLGALRSSMNRIRAADLGIDPTASRVAPTTAPVGYMFVAEDSTLSMGVFTVDRGCRLPLHDHRTMHGVIKVLFGTIRIQSYDPLTEEQMSTISPPDLSEYPAGSWQQLARTLLPARKRAELELTSDSEPCVLTPTEANLHSIESVSGPAAFLDILSPPYNPELGRDCMYYKETNFAALNQNIGDVKWLQRIPQPASFWCCQEAYLGPAVDLNKL